MRQKLPEKTIVTCDICKRSTDGEPRTYWRQNGGLVLKRDALDMHGHPCADASVRLDLCDVCLQKVSEAINGLAEVHKTEQASS